MKNARMNISHSRFIFFNLKFSGEKVNPFYYIPVQDIRMNPKKKRKHA